MLLSILSVFIVSLLIGWLAWIETCRKLKLVSISGAEPHSADPEVSEVFATIEDSSPVPKVVDSLPLNQQTLFPEKITIGLLCMLGCLIVGVGGFFTNLRWHSDFFRAASISFVLVLLIPIVISDFRRRIMPNRYLLMGLVIRILQYAFLLASGQELMVQLRSDILGALLGGAVFLLSFMISKKSVGMGDIKLFGVTGLFLGLQGTYTLLIITMVFAFIHSMILMALKKKKMKDEMPLGPYVLTGLIVGILLGM